MTADMPQIKSWQSIIGDENEAQQRLFLPDQLEPVSFLRNEEDYITGEELTRRAKEMQANLGLLQAKYLLKHEKDIPKKWRLYYLVFPGTICYARDDGLGYVPCLDWFDGSWRLYFRCFAGVNSVFFTLDRLLRPRE